MSRIAAYAVDGSPSSPLEALDPRVRIGYAAIFAVFVVLTPSSSPFRFLVHGASGLGLSVTARVSVAVYLKRVGPCCPSS